jgi:hypothetical protein
MSEDKVEQAINVLVQDCTSKGTIGYYKDGTGVSRENADGLPA